MIFKHVCGFSILIFLLQYQVTLGIIRILPHSSKRSKTQIRCHRAFFYFPSPIISSLIFHFKLPVFINIMNQKQIPGIVILVIRMYPKNLVIEVRKLLNFTILFIIRVLRQVMICLRPVPALCCRKKNFVLHQYLSRRRISIIHR